eukprot:Tbor_TRINITY_DN5802_c0_g1::TRINITY_DN5802_c0_g1_i10::g.7211::m.7211
MKGIESLRENRQVTGSGYSTTPGQYSHKLMNESFIDSIFLKAGNNGEIDSISAAFAKGGNTRHLLKRLQKGRVLLFPINIENHWVLGRVSWCNTAVTVEVYESTPGPKTKQAIKELFQGPSIKFFGTTEVSYPECPTQPEGSSESGIHVLVNAASAVKEKRCNCFLHSKCRIYRKRIIIIYITCEGLINQI